MKKSQQFFPLLCICLLAGCFCSHKWEDATCKAPKTCSLCNLTEGTALEHQWSALTSEEEYVCTACGTASGVAGPHVDVRNITQDPNNNLLERCKCGHEEIYTIDQLMLHLMQGKWTLRAVLMCNGRTEYGEDIYTDVPLVLIFGDRGYAKEPLTDDEFINAALKGTVTSLWRHRDGGMYIYGYDIG